MKKYLFMIFILVFCSYLTAQGINESVDGYTGYSNTGDNTNTRNTVEDIIPVKPADADTNAGNAVKPAAATNLLPAKIKEAEMKEVGIPIEGFNKQCPDCKNYIPDDAESCPFCDYKFSRESRSKILELSLFFGFLGGAVSPTITQTSEGEQLYFSTGGKYDFGLSGSTYFLKNFLLNMNFGYCTGGLSIPVSGLDGNFVRYPLRFNLYYRIKIKDIRNTSYILYFGPGLSYYLSPVLTYSIRNYKQVLNYNTAAGFNGIIGINIVNKQFSWFLIYLEFRYYNVNYKLKNIVDNGILRPGSEMPSSWQRLDGAGYGIYLGLGFRI